MGVDISILLPTRKRPNFLLRLFDSLKETTARPENLEVVLYADEDDEETLSVEYGGLNIVRLVRPPGATMGAINTACYEASTGRYVLLANDDLVFRTRGWDEAFMDAFARHPDGIALVYANDLFQEGRVPNFPALSRTACEVMGGICPTEYIRVSIDIHIFDIFKKLARMGHSRIVYLPEVVIEHMHYEAGKAPLDMTYANRENITDDVLYLAWEDERSYIARKLAEYIEKNAESA